MRLEQSPSFQRSGALLLLLDFLIESAKEGSVEETSVGVEFYKREATYDPRSDSIARVNVWRLRRKLEQFYASEGAAEAFQIIIPRGSFTPLLAAGPGLRPVPEGKFVAQDPAPPEEYDPGPTPLEEDEERLVSPDAPRHSSAPRQAGSRKF